MGLVLFPAIVVGWGVGQNCLDANLKFQGVYLLRLSKFPGLGSPTIISMNLTMFYLTCRYREGAEYVDDRCLPQNQTVLPESGVRVPGCRHALGGSE